MWLRLKRDKDKTVSELQSMFGLFFGIGNGTGTPVGGSAVNVRSPVNVTAVPMDSNVKAVNELLRRCIVT